VLSAGHSEATAAGVEAAIGAGLSGVTHLFNAMSQITPRQPGLVGMALGDERLMAGIICDGLHVAPLNLRPACRLMGRERLMLVTDAMPTVGGTDRTFSFEGRRAIGLDGGRLTDPDGTLAGASQHDRGRSQRSDDDGMHSWRRAGDGVRHAGALSRARPPARSDRRGICC
jgi:N-acetylglucosamine-6-phosphate deacetylase